MTDTPNDVAKTPLETAPIESPAIRVPFFSRLRRGFRFPKTWQEVKALGWKAILGFVIFYLIRDLILYVLIPYLVYRGVTN